MQKMLYMSDVHSIDFIKATSYLFQTPRYYASNWVCDTSSSMSIVGAV